MYQLSYYLFGTYISFLFHFLSPQHPEIVECAIFPRKDDRYGEVVACAIVTKGGGSIPLDTIKEWCRQNGLAGYKAPKILFFIKSLPRNTSGKVLKHKLVTQFGSNPRSKL